MPWFKFYTSDWLTEPALRMCSLTARGAWVDLICYMEKAGTYEITGSLLDIARMLGCEYDTAKAVIIELVEKGVCDSDMPPDMLHVTDANVCVTLLSRRRCKEAKSKSTNTKRQKRYRDKQARNGDNDGVESESESENTISAEPVEDDDSVPVPSDSVFSFGADCMVGRGTGPWHVPQALHESFVDAYPMIVHLAEYRKAAAWLLANRPKRKTRRGMPKFLNGWMERNQNRGPAPAPKPQHRPPADVLYDD